MIFPIFSIKAKLRPIDNLKKAFPEKLCSCYLLVQLDHLSVRVKMGSVAGMAMHKLA